MSTVKAVPVTEGIHIDTAQIPAHVALNIGQVAFQAILRDYQRPEIQADYQRWKVERAAKAARGTANG